MTSDKLKAAWKTAGDAMTRFPQDWSADSSLPSSATDFLRDVGLPEEAAPGLNFGPQYARNFAPWDLPHGVVPIGSNGSGDPVVVTRDGRVVYLNYDADFAETYVSRDIRMLVETLLRLRELIVETQNRNGPDAYLDGTVPADLKADFVSFLKTADPAALTDATMWTEELRQWEGRV